MYKLITIDLDGTLLNSNIEVSNENKIAIQKAVKSGAEVVLTSGRVKKSIKNYATQIGCDNYLIAGNGSVIHDIKNNTNIFNSHIPKNEYMQIIDICEQNSIYYAVYLDDLVITKSLKYSVSYYHKENVNLTEENKIKIRLVENIYNYLEENKSEVTKIIICDEDKGVFTNIIKKLRQINNVSILDVGHASRKMVEDTIIQFYYTEVSNENVNKWEAINYLIKILNIKPEEVMAIGDNVNDKEMLQNAGLGVVMGNAAPYIKEIGDVVVSDNNSNGVAEAIEKYILN